MHMHNMHVARMCMHVHVCMWHVHVHVSERT